MELIQSKFLLVMKTIRITRIPGTILDEWLDRPRSSQNLVSSDAFGERNCYYISIRILSGKNAGTWI
jgi:hypothetical protein